MPNESDGAVSLIHVQLNKGRLSNYSMLVLGKR